MAFVDMDSVHFYQPPSMAGRLGEGRSAALNHDVRAISNESYNPMALKPSSNSSDRPEDYNPIEPCDLTVSLPRKSLDLFRESIVAQVDTRDPQSHAIGSSDDIDLECSQGRRDYVEDNNLLPLNELLFGVGGAQELHRAELRHDYGMGRSDSAFGHPLQNDCNHTSIPGSKQCGAKGEDIDGISGSSLHLSSDGPTCEAQGEHCSFDTPSTSVAGSEARHSILREKIEKPISDPPFLLPYTLLSPIHDDAHKDTKAYHPSSEGKEKKDKRGSLKEDVWGIEEPGFPYGSITTTGVTGIRGFSKRTANSARLNESGKSVHRSEKARRTNLIVIGKTDDPNAYRRSLSPVISPPSPPRPVLRNPWKRLYQQRQNTANSSQSSAVGDSQDNPLVIEDDAEPINDIGNPIRPTSVEFEFVIARSHVRIQPKTHGCLNARTINEPTISPLDRPPFPRLSLSQDWDGQKIRRGNYGAGVTVHPYSATAVTLDLPERLQGKRHSAPDGEGMGDREDYWKETDEKWL